MIDPVQRGRVSAIATNAARPNLATQTTPKAVTVSEAPAASTRSGLPMTRLLDLAADLARAEPPVDYARIAQVRRAIADGAYQIDSAALAKAMIRFGEPR